MVHIVSLQVNLRKLFCVKLLPSGSIEMSHFLSERKSKLLKFKLKLKFNCKKVRSYKITEFWREKRRKKRFPFPFPILQAKQEKVPKYNYFGEKREESRLMLFSPFLSVNGIRRRSGDVQKIFRCKENNCFSRKISGKVKKTFAAKRIIISQGEEVEKFRKFFSARRIIISQGEEVEKFRNIFAAKRINVSQGR